jgi:N utilization substance protein B
MANRRLSRSIALQTLFEWDSADYVLGQDELFRRLDNNVAEFGGSESDKPFMQSLIKTVVAKRKELDDIIERAAPEWPIDKIARIDRNVIRIGLAELLFADKSQVPAKVAINEAVELGKTFGSESSSKFVNGVLGAVYVELGEPGKDDAPKRDKKMPREDMVLEHLAGAVVYAKHEGNTYLAFVHDIFGHWTISKGKVEQGENIQQGAIREIKEEMNLDIKIRSELGVNEYIANDPAAPGGKKRKRVTYFLAESPFSDIKLGPSGGLDAAQWFPLGQVGNLNFYDDTLKIIVPAINVLAQKEPAKEVREVKEEKEVKVPKPRKKK